MSATNNKSENDDPELDVLSKSFNAKKALYSSNTPLPERHAPKFKSVDSFEKRIKQKKILQEMIYRVRSENMFEKFNNLKIE